MSQQELNLGREDSHLEDYYANVHRIHARCTPEKRALKMENSIWGMWNGDVELPPGSEHLIHERNFRKFKAEMQRVLVSY